jgi:hypothetical protein
MIKEKGRGFVPPSLAAPHLTAIAKHAHKAHDQLWQAYDNAKVRPIEPPVIQDARIVAV